MVFARRPHLVPENSLPARLLRDARPDAEIAGVAFWADSALLGQHIPTALFGPRGHGAHAIDEWVSLQSLARVYATVAEVIEGMDGF